MADLHVPIRAGTDIAFLGGIINYILEHEPLSSASTSTHYTNARDDRRRGVPDTEDLDGVFSGWDPEPSAYDIDDLAVRGHGGRRRRPASASRARPASRRTARTAASSSTASRRETDPTLAAPALRLPDPASGTSRRYTPEMVERDLRHARGEPFLEVAEALCANSGRERTSAFCYAVGWTQHTVGVQNIRTAAILQLLLGNIGRPGRRDHGAARPRLDPGLDRHPDALQHPARLPADAARRTRTTTLDDYVETNAPPTGYWGHMRRLHRSAC